MDTVNEKVASYYNQRGEKYSVAWTPEAKRRLSLLEIDFIRQAMRSVQENIGNRPLKVLAIGMGTGRISEALLKENVELYGTDISETMVRICREKFTNHPKVRELAVHNIANPLPESWGMFDMVTAMRVLSYTKDWRQMIKYILKSMNTGGVLVFTFPNKYSTMFLTQWVWKGKYPLGAEVVSYREMKKAIKEIGFSECKIVGLNKLFDTIYDWCDGTFSASILFGIERILKFFLGDKIFTREFYIECKK